MATTLYAQSTGNLSAISWNTAANGSGSNQSPTSADTLVANGYNITLDASYSFVQLKQTSNGGTFIPASATTLTLTDSTTGLVSGSNVTPSVVTHSGSGVANIVGLLVGTTYTSPLIGVTGSGTLNVTTNSLLGQTTYTTGVLSISGSGCTVNITAGQIVGGTNGVAIICGSSATVNITGPLTGGTQPALNITGAATVTITGTSTASASSPAVVNTSTTAVLRMSGPFVNSGRRMAVQSPVLQIGSSSTYWDMVDYSNAARNLYTADQIGGNPAAADVRNGTTYGPVGELTGTCHVPGAASVLAGVPIDATVGTVTLTAAGLRAALGMASANLDTQLAALPTEAEIAAAVWAYVTRTITSGGITAQQVWEYATRTLTESTGGGATAKEIWEYVSTLLPDGAEAMLAGIAARLAEQVPTGPVVVLPAPAAGQTIAWVMCYGPSGAIESGVTISIFLSKTTEDGAFDAAAAVLTSDEDGLAQGPIPRGAGHTFKARRGKDGKLYTFAGVDADTLALPSLLGSP